MKDLAPEQNPSPSNLPAVLLEVLKAHFQANSTQFRFNQNNTETKLAIQKSEAFDPASVGKRPALYIKRGMIQVNRDTIGDTLGRDPKLGRLMFIRLSGTITVYCLARTGGEADALTGEVLDCLLCFQTLISEDFSFIRFKVNSIGEVGILEDYKELFMTPVIIEYDAEMSYVLGEEALPIKKLLLSLKIEDSEVENTFNI